MKEILLTFLITLGAGAAFGKLSSSLTHHPTVSDDATPVERVIVCQAHNMARGESLIMTAISFIGNAYEIAASMILAVSNPPELPSDCFEGLTEAERKAVVSSKEYRDFQKAQASRISRISGPTL